MASYIHGLDAFGNLTNSQHRTSIKLRVIVVGGGVAGLAVALSLKLYGHDVIVLERFSEYEAIDAPSGGIRCPPNMTRLFNLAPAAYTSLVENSTECSGLSLLSGATGELACDLVFPPDMIKDLAAPFLMTQKKTFTRMAYDLCLHQKTKFLFNTEVVSIDTSSSDHVTVKLKNGQTMTAEMVIGADGMDSVARETVIEAEEEEELLGTMSGVSLSIPLDRMLKDPQLADLARSSRLPLWMNDGFSVTGGLHKDYYDLAFLSTLRHHGKHDIRRRTKFTLDDFAVFEVEKMEPRIKKMIQAAESCYFTTQHLYAYDRVADPTSRVILIGDAARAPPIHGTHNCANAVEDGASFGALLNYFTSRKQLPLLMQSYEEIRQPRSTETQREQLHGQAGVSLPDGPEKEARDAAYRFVLRMSENGRYMDDALLADTWGDHLRQFDHDAVESVSAWWLNWGRYNKELCPL